MRQCVQSAEPHLGTAEGAIQLGPAPRQPCSPSCSLTLVGPLWDQVFQEGAKRLRKQSALIAYLHSGL